MNRMPGIHQRGKAVAPMDLEQALHDLNRALQAVSAEAASPRRLQAARQVLISQGVAALATEPRTGLSLAEMIRIAVTEPPSPDRRSFAILLVHALGVDGLVQAGSPRAGLDRCICSFVESALQTAL
jgi:hypothetical protein